MMNFFRRFIHEQHGAYAVSCAMLFPFLFGMLSLALEGSRYITERARLSDAMEQAALALTAENNGAGQPRNSVLAKHYFSAYMRHDKRVYEPTIRVFTGFGATGQQLEYVEYRVSGSTGQDSWLTSSFFPSFPERVDIGDNGAARKFRSNIDVVFAADFTGSMNDPLPDGGIKIDALKSIVLMLSRELFSFPGLTNKVGVIPFAWGVSNNSGLCILPFVSNSSKAQNAFKDTKDVPYDEIRPFSLISPYFDIRATVQAIPSLSYDISASPGDISPFFCTSGASTSQIPLTTDINEINRLQSMVPLGNTLVSSGILAGAHELSKGTAARRVLVVVSDGQDAPGLGISAGLLANGMCEKIRRELSTKYSVGKIAFIAVGYIPTEDWEACVGKTNFYTPETVKEFESAMRKAVFEEVGHNIIKD
ncbi:protein TadG, associated with Flp pilus assembly [Salmonella enterica]|nr:protein TadG, associated with Flp pilus assembly [Salmonella enterica]ECO1042798.1 protein TadG, associated with Flp pilus assembly [Salmonella enterica subsp. enterica serovar Newport]